MSVNKPTICISAERLRELEYIETHQSTIIEQAVQDYVDAVAEKQKLKTIKTIKTIKTPTPKPKSPKTPKTPQKEPKTKKEQKEQNEK